MSESQDTDERLDNLNDMLEIFSSNLEYVIYSIPNFAKKKTQGDNGLVIAINAPWGMGKSFFIDYFIDRIKNNDNHICAVEYTNNGQLKTSDEKKKLVLPIKYNAWLDDYVDPFISLVAQVYKEAKDINKSLADNFLETAKPIIKFAIKCFKHVPYIGAGVQMGQDVSEAVFKGEFGDELQQYKEITKAKKQFKKALSCLNAENGNCIKLIFIDELDRCEPRFAIKVLEMLKHFFNAENTVFIITLDREALYAYVKHFYGYEVNPSYYLSRFFDIELELPVDKNFSRKLVEKHLKNRRHQELLLYLVENIGVSTRNQIKICGHLDLLNGLNNLDRGEMIPLLILRVHDNTQFQKLIDFRLSPDDISLSIDNFMKIILGVGVEDWLRFSDSLGLLLCCIAQRAGQLDLLTTYVENVDNHQETLKLICENEESYLKSQFFEEFLALVCSLTNDRQTYKV